MTRETQIPQYGSDNYAVVDLGSNSFHLLITRLNGNNIEVVDKVKRKVRLAAGLDSNNTLSSEAIERGLDCLKLFAEHLNGIPQENITIVATATLRIAKNSQDFLQAANTILPLNIKLLSGEQEASTIYAGVAYTCQHTKSTQKRLVIDIGGASTEIIVGEAGKAKHLVSLNIGCVSFREKYFPQGQLTEDNFNKAITAASNEITEIASTFINEGWQKVMGSSGTMQALAEILRFQKLEETIHYDFLQEVKKKLIACQHIDNINIEGLRADRLPVLASGLAILIALFDVLGIKELNLSTGALREGLLFSLLPKNTSISLVKH